MAEIRLSRAAHAAAAGGGPPAAPAYETVQTFHTNADVDADTNALHHTLGGQASEAAPGDHTHDGGSSTPLFQGQSVSGVRGSQAYYQSLEALLTQLGAGNSATGP